MTGLVRKATLFVACGLITAATAFANVPSPGNSDVPEWVPVVGTSGGVPAPGNVVTVVVRDFLNNPIAGSAVLFDFSGMSDIRLCTASVAGTGTVNCGAGTVLATTDGTGTVSITVLGAATNNTGSEPGHGVGAGQIYADGVPLGPFTSPAVDQDGAGGGANGTSGLDLSLSSQDILNDNPNGSYYRGRSDYSEDGDLSGLDLSFHAQAVLDGTSSQGCHNGTSAQSYCL